jgi:hypothetical protein
VEHEAAGVLVALAPAETARGEVREARGRGAPIEGAEIVLYTELGARHARTDKDGAYTVSELAAGPARLRVRAPGYAPRELDVAVDALAGARPATLPRVELGGAGEVTGTVVDGRGDPVQGARIAKDRVPVFLAVGTTPQKGVAVADARGRFRLADLPEGACVLEVYAPDLGRARVDAVSIVAGRSTDLGKITLKKDAEAAAESTARGNVAVTLGEASDVREVVLVNVAEASEAERAGLAPNDVLLDVDGSPVRTIAEARAKLAGPLGDDVVLKLRRGPRVLSIRVAREEVRR